MFTTEAPKRTIPARLDDRLSAHVLWPRVSTKLKKLEPLRTCRPWTERLSQLRQHSHRRLRLRPHSSSTAEFPDPYLHSQWYRNLRLVSRIRQAARRPIGCKTLGSSRWSVFRSGMGWKRYRFVIYVDAGNAVFPGFFAKLRFLLIRGLMVRVHQGAPARNSQPRK